MILYKKDSKEKIRFLEIKTEGSDLIQISGIVGTDNPVEHRKTCKSKNIGKSNETKSREQAIFEMESKIREKLTEGYFYTIKECETEEVILPMLAKNFDDEKHKIDWNNCFIQPKLDGMRCLAHIKSNGNVTLISRDGKIITNMEHIIDDLSSIGEDIILDGELYAHGLTFQENMKLIKKWRTNTSELIKFHVYDIINDLPFKDRKIREFIKDLNTCQEVSTYEIINKEKLDYFHAINISEGYEGSIIRWGDEGYKKNGRSSNLLKFKDFKDMDLIITDIIPNDANPLHGTPRFILNKKSFKAGVKMSHEDREDLLKNKNQYIGKIANIRYFELTDEGIPRFPVMIGIHEDR